MGIIHLGLVLGFGVYVVMLANAGVAQWQLAWRPLQRLDWPPSLLLFSLPSPRGSITWLPWPLDAPSAFLMPALLFGVVGTFQYMTIGYLVGLLRGALSRRAEGTAALSQ